MERAPQRENVSTHPAYFCTDCKRSHDGSALDARTILGERGTLGGIAYAWSTRRSAYNLVCPMSALEAQRVALVALSRIINGRYIPRTPKMPRYRARVATNTDVRTRIVDVRAFAYAYDAQRSRLGRCIGRAA